MDDHQVALAAELDRRGLALAREADLLTFADLQAAAGRSVLRSGEVQPFVLDPDPQRPRSYSLRRRAGTWRSPAPHARP